MSAPLQHPEYVNFDPRFKLTITTGVVPVMTGAECGVCRRILISEPTDAHDRALEARMRALTTNSPQGQPFLETQESDPMSRLHLDDEVPMSASPETGRPVVPSPWNVFVHRSYGELDDLRRDQWAKLRAARTAEDRLDAQRMIDMLGIAMGLTKFREADRAYNAFVAAEKARSDAAQETADIAKWTY